MPNNKILNQILFFTLLLLVVSRISIISLTELIDPTETRYSVVAQIMATDGDWLVPKIPLTGGIEPFLGKPPFHFWVTAGLYQILGFTNFASRFPSFIFSLIIILAVVFFGHKTKNLTFGLTAALFTFSSAVFYLFSGASAVDMTLTAFVTLALAAFYLWHIKAISNFSFITIFSSSLSLGFLTKGPVTFVYVGLSILSWILLTKKYQLFTDPIWLKVTAVIILITSPWFIISEIKNPGFLKYFFLQENLERFFSKEFSNRYGGAPKLPFGAAWVIIIANTIPWSPLAILMLFKKSLRKNLLDEVKNNTFFLYLVTWCFVPVLFLTFTRKIHSSYLLQSVPPFCLILAFLIQKIEYKDFLTDKFWYLSKMLFAFTAGLFIASFYIGQNILLVLLVSLIALLSVLMVSKLLEKNSEVVVVKKILLCSILCACAYCIVTLSGSQSLNLKKSTTAIMHEIAQREHDNNKVTPKTIGILTKNIYSYYWITNKWRAKGKYNYQVKYITEKEIPNARFNLLVEDKFAELIWDQFKSYYVKEIKIGKWVWLKRIDSFESTKHE